MRREAMQHRWPVAAALALSAFLPKHAAIFKADTFAPVCESYFDDEDREVRFAVPYEAFGRVRASRPQRLTSDPAEGLHRHLFATAGLTPRGGSLDAPGPS